MFVHLCLYLVVHGDAACQYTSDYVLHPFAFRTHAHALGITVFFIESEVLIS